MNYQLVERRIQQAAEKWYTIQFVRQMALFFSVACGIVLVMGAAVWLRWITEPGTYWTTVSLLIAAALVAWVLVAVRAGMRASRSFLAASIETAQPQLLDRLNTLVHLEKQRSDPATAPFYQRIQQQTNVEFQRRPPAVCYPTRPLRIQLAVLAVTLVATIWFYQRYDPYALLVHVVPEAPAAIALDTPPDDILETGAGISEERKVWGEVIITDPARDMQVTKVDVVPLQIEAAANEELRKVGWLTGINGGKERVHELPQPAEPRYAVYKPTVYLDEFNLTDWDVMTYYAKADTDGGKTHASQVYFLEVRPFREDILKMPGGEGGKAYQALNELTSLIEQQTHVIRETHKHLQQPPDDQKMLQQDRTKLADAESDLSKAARHLYSEMSAEMENMPIGPAQDQLAKAEKSLQSASKALRDNAEADVPSREREALADLVAARKIFQKAVSDNPEAFEPKPDQQPTPTASGKDALEKIAEFRDEAKAVQQALNEAVEKQRALASEARKPSTAPAANAARSKKQKELQREVENLQKDHPQAFKGLEKECAGAGQAMGQAARDLAGTPAKAGTSTQKAAEQLQQLRDAQQSQSAGQQLADAYKLKGMLEQQIQKMEEVGKSPGNFSSADMGQMASKSAEALKQLQQAATQQPGGDMFGQPLKDALGESKMSGMNEKLESLGKARTAAARQASAGEAKEALKNVTEAFEKSAPKPMQMARSGDALKPSEQGARERGIGQLNSLLQRMESGKPASKEDQRRQGDEALTNLENAMRPEAGKSEQARALLAELNDKLKGENAIEIEDLRRLISQLQHFSVELAAADRDSQKAEVGSINADAMPPAYRGRIEKYFQKLSEKGK